MPKKFYTSKPADYPLCEHRDCPMAATCLHQTAYDEALKESTILPILNPTRCVKDNTCPFYRDSTPVIYAKGFSHFQRKMFPEQYQTFKTKLTATFGKSGYYERRRGTTALSPKEQKIVLNTLKEAGITEEMKFESYIKNFNWND